MLVLVLNSSLLIVCLLVHYDVVSDVANIKGAIRPLDLFLLIVGANVAIGNHFSIIR